MVVEHHIKAKMKAQHTEQETIIEEINHLNEIVQESAEEVEREHQIITKRTRGIIRLTQRMIKHIIESITRDEEADLMKNTERDIHHQIRAVKDTSPKRSQVKNQVKAKVRRMSHLNDIIPQKMRESTGENIKEVNIIAIDLKRITVLFLRIFSNKSFYFIKVEYNFIECIFRRS